jgi:hypothetical protein
LDRTASFLDDLLANFAGKLRARFIIKGTEMSELTLCDRRSRVTVWFIEHRHIRDVSAGRAARAPFGGFCFFRHPFFVVLDLFDIRMLVVRISV